MSSIFRMFAVLCAMPFAVASFDSSAQTTPAPDEAAKPPAKAQPARKPAPPKAEAAPKADAAPKAPVAPKKPPAKKSGAIKAPVKPEPVKAPAASANPNITVLKSGQRSPVTLRDKDGNVIPTSPDAYDVSSAMGKKK
jgi:hypothetical protein